jgi:citrate synthase
VSRESCATADTRSSSWRRKSTFLEVSYLLIYGELPSQPSSTTSRPHPRHTLLHEDLKRFFDGLPAQRAPDAGAVVGA